MLLYINKSTVYPLLVSFGLLHTFTWTLGGLYIHVTRTEEEKEKSIKMSLACAVLGLTGLSFLTRVHLSSRRSIYSLELIHDHLKIKNRSLFSSKDLSLPLNACSLVGDCNIQEQKTIGLKTANRVFLLDAGGIYLNKKHFFKVMEK